jgi:hypothetical protein
MLNLIPNIGNIFSKGKKIDYSSSGKWMREILYLRHQWMGFFLALIVMSFNSNGSTSSAFTLSSILEE